LLVSAAAMQTDPRDKLFTKFTIIMLYTKMDAHCDHLGQSSVELCWKRLQQFTYRD